MNPIDGFSSCHNIQNSRLQSIQVINTNVKKKIRNKFKPSNETNTAKGKKESKLNTSIKGPNNQNTQNLMKSKKE
jgi:hypothetical protein